MSQTLYRLARKLAVASAVALASVGAYAGEAAHQHGHRDSTGKMSPPVGKWRTDAVLRAGMENIRREMLARKQGIERETLSAADYRSLAAGVDRNIANIVTNCRLEPDADAAYHETVLRDMSWGSETMRTSPRAPVQRAGALAIMQALAHYGQYFDHPGWDREGGVAR